jgi:hypothetical protein
MSGAMVEIRYANINNEATAFMVVGRKPAEEGRQAEAILALPDLAATHDGSEWDKHEVRSLSGAMVPMRFTRVSTGAVRSKDSPPATWKGKFTAFPDAESFRQQSLEEAYNGIETDLEESFVADEVMPDGEEKSVEDLRVLPNPKSARTASGASDRMTPLKAESPSPVRFQFSGQDSSDLGEAAAVSAILKAVKDLHKVVDTERGETRRLIAAETSQRQKLESVVEKISTSLESIVEDRDLTNTKLESLSARVEQLAARVTIAKQVRFGG